MRHSSTAVPGDEEVVALSRALAAMSAAMGEQSEFSTGKAVDFGVSSLREAAARAERRVARLPIAGAIWRREILKTLASDCLRGLLLVDHVLAAAGADAWPDLASAAEAAARAVTSLAREAPDLVRIDKCPDPASLPPASAPLVEWTRLTGGGKAARLPSGFAAVILPNAFAPGGTRCMGVLGLVGVSLATDEAEALQAIIEADAALSAFAARPALPCHEPR